MKNPRLLRSARASAIAALYALLTCAFMPIGYGPAQFRPAEALTLLPLFYPESAIALFLGCLVSDAASPFGALDAALGSLATLAAALATREIGRRTHRLGAKILLGGLPPVFFNALILPLVWLPLGDWRLYALDAASILASEALAVYALGAPLASAASRFMKKGLRGFGIAENAAKPRQGHMGADSDRDESQTPGDGQTP